MHLRMNKSLQASSQVASLTASHDRGGLCAQAQRASHQGGAPLPSPCTDQHRLLVQEHSTASPIIAVTGSNGGGPVGACTKGPYTITEGSTGPAIIFDNVRPSPETVQCGTLSCGVQTLEL